MAFILYILILAFIVVMFLYLYSKSKLNFTKTHFLFILVFFEFLIFTFVSPLYGYLNNIHTIFGNDVREYYDEIMIIYSIAIFSFFIGYIFFIGKKRFKMFKAPSLVVSKNYIRFFFILALVAILLWSKLTNFGLTNIFVLEHINKDNFSGGYNYLLFMMEFSIGAMILAPFSNMKSREILLWTLLFTAIFLLFGFRYRLIMVVLVSLSSYIIKNNFSRKSIKSFIFLILAALLIFSLFSNIKSVGRNLGTKNNVEIEVANIDKFGYYLHKNTNNYLHFMSLYKSFDNNDCSHDYGHSIFFQTIYRALPSNFFENNTKPTPYSLSAIARSYGSIQGLYAGGAITNIGHFYYSFSVFGVVFGMILMGILVAYITNSFIYNQNLFTTFLYILAFTLSFHFISRGYIPQIINDLFFIAFPLIVLVFKNKFKRKRKLYV